VDPSILEYDPELLIKIRLVKKKKNIGINNNININIIIDVGMIEDYHLRRKK